MRVVRSTSVPRRGVPAAHDQISLPVVGHRSLRPLRGAFLNAQHCGDGAASLRTASPHPPVFPSVSKRPKRLPFERAAGQHVQVRVDRLMRDTHRVVIRIRTFSRLAMCSVDQRCVSCAGT